MNKVNIEDFIAYNYLGNLKISPDEKHAIFTHITGNKEKDNYPANIWILNLEDASTHPLTSGDAERSYIWWDEETIVFSGCREATLKEKIADHETWTILYKLNIHGGEAQEWLRLPMSIASFEKVNDTTMIISASTSCNHKNFYECTNEEEKKAFKQEVSSHKDYEWFDEIPFWANGAGITNGKRSSLFVLNIETKEITPISDAYANAHINHISNTKVLYTSNPMKDVRVIPSSLHLYDIETKEDITLVQDYEVSVNWAFFIKEKIIASLSSYESYGYHQHGTLYEIKMDKTRTTLVHFDNTYGASLGSDCLQQFGNPLCAYKDHIYFSCSDENDGCIKCFDEYGNITILSDYNGGIESFDVCEKGIYFIGLRGQKLQEIYKLEDKKEIQLTSFNTKMMEETSFSNIEKFTFYSDGIRHEGFVIKPTNFDETKMYPGILEIHGGPKGTFGPVISHEMQVFANNGYFVFFANPRGSDSRGNAFADIRGRFGKEDYVDLMNFTDAVLERYPNLDKEHLGVTGSSYGGYMTNWIITQTNRFKAAIPEASISNYITKFLCTDIGFTYNISNQGADPWSDLDLVWEQSPLKYANKCTTPTLFIHSDQDYRCWIAEPIQMFYALKLHGCEAKFLLFHGEHHGLPIFGKPTHRIKRLEEMLNWFDAHLK